jgi:hypothetical protein
MPTVPVHALQYDGGSNQHRNGVQRRGPSACKDYLFEPCPPPMTFQGWDFDGSTYTTSNLTLDPGTWEASLPACGPQNRPLI